MEFIDPKIEDYAKAFSEGESPLLKKINRETWYEVMMPRMLSGHLQGRVLSFFSRMLRPKLILEVGTYTGYSALCLAEGLLPEGKLITIDNNDELRERVNGYFSSSEYAHQIDYRIGHALDLIPQLEGPFDLVFLDADKVNYSNYFDLVKGKLSPHGIVIADNVLWSGKVTEPMIENDADTRALHAYNQKVSIEPGFKSLLLPVRDGLMISIKQEKKHD
jgi:predicted O-methyltransferase YrrM